MTQDIRVPAEIIRAERFEVVGRDGKVRAVLGRLREDNGHGSYGVALLDETGARIELVVGPGGPFLYLSQGGNGRILVAIDEGHEAIVPGPKILLCDRDGHPVETIEVEDPVPKT